MNTSDDIKKSNGRAMPGDMLNFWGKARPTENSGASESSRPLWHPLPYHSLDVAAVGKVILERNERLRCIIASVLGIDEGTAVSLCVFLLALHDLGKFSKPFQKKAMPELYRGNFGGDPDEAPPKPRHDDAGWLFWEGGAGEEICGDCYNEYVIDPLARAVFGHHGEPPSDDFGGGGEFKVRRDFGEMGFDAAMAFAKTTAKILPLPEKLDCKEKNARRASYLVAGLAVLSDWLGSNQDWFPYRAPGLSLADYWEQVATNLAESAVEKAGVIPAIPADKVLSFSDLTLLKEKPTAMQNWAETTPLPDGPTLFIIEDVTGSGKTEASLMLAHRLIVKGRANGIYVGLPTQATANAMFNRVAKVYRNLFSKKTDPSLVLAHGARDFHPQFKEMKISSGPLDHNDEKSDEVTDTTATAQCAAWIRSSHKKAFLADVGIGTVDQALLAVLSSRHQSLRLAGLAQHVLILDEIHAYDAYVQQEIIGLLKFQAALGGDAVLLSATLSQEARQHFIWAWNSGLGIEYDAENDRADAYPLATTVSGDGVCQYPCEAAAMSHREVLVRFINPEDNSAIEEIKQAADEGQAVVYIRNTVDDAIEAWKKLSDAGLEPLLFHARFALCDRIKIENTVLEKFDKDSTLQERRGQILVATQVVEQSLDLDFDFMVSDLAPVDLLIQRAGRLWRHPERERCKGGRPELLVVSPEPTDDAAEDWMKQAFPRAAWVYRDHARLWLTARTLQKAGVICTPDELRALIESVYEIEAEDEIPDDLKNSRLQMEGKAGAEKGVANQNLLKPSNGYTRMGTSWADDARVVTRLEEGPTVTLRLARLEGDEIVPWSFEDNHQFDRDCWRLSEVRVSQKKFSRCGYVVPSHLESAVEKATQDWKVWERNTIHLVVLVKNDENGWVAGKTLRYNRKEGFKFLATKNEKD